MTQAKKGIKISTKVFILIIIFAALLAVLAFQKEPNAAAITTFSDILKVLAGALAGAIAGEREK